jgi:hypothetical protein
MLHEIGRRREKILLLFFLALIFLFCFNQINNADSFYHLKVGQLILQAGYIPYADVFSYTAAGASWVPHEWLAELIFFAIQNAFGFWGLMTFIAALAMATFYFIFRMAREKGANLFITLPVLFIIGVASFPFWVPRPQVFVFFFCIVLIERLEKYRTGPKKKYLWWSALIIWAWANMNASVALGMLIIIVFLIAIGERERYWSSTFKNFTWMLLGGAALSFINPSTYKIYTYGATILPAIHAFNVYEWQPILSYWSGVDTKFFVFEIVATALFLGWHLGIRRESRNLAWLCLVVGASIMPFIASRYLPYWSLFVAAPLAWSLSDILKTPLAKISSRKIFAVLLVACGGLLIFRIVTLPGEYIDRSALPISAANFLANNNAQGNLFNTYTQGGYLIWRLWPNLKIAMDGRSEVYLGRPTDEYYAILKDGTSAASLINQKYDIQYFLLPYDPAFLAKTQPLLSYLNKSGWQIVWWDDGAVIFARNDAQNQNLIKKYALHYVGPFIDPATIKGTAVRPAAAEIQSLMSRAPDSVTVTNYANDFLIDHGEKVGSLNP